MTIASTDEKKVKTMRRALLIPFIVSPLLAALLFGAAGRVDLPWAWGAWGVLFFNHLIAAWLFVWLRPELVKERMKPGKGIQNWDKVLLPGYILGVLVHVVVTGMGCRKVSLVRRHPNYNKDRRKYRSACIYRDWLLGGCREPVFFKRGAPSGG